MTDGVWKKKNLDLKFAHFEHKLILKKIFFYSSTVLVIAVIIAMTAVNKLPYTFNLHTNSMYYASHNIT